jgi:hypothetical protein
MPWTYDQRSGRLHRPNGQVAGDGYSGNFLNANYPPAQSSQFAGPIPAGSYTIGQAYQHPTKGPLTRDLTPIGHSAAGRSDFRIHGDNRSSPGNASAGCVILSPDIRNEMALSPDRVLKVR